MSGKRVLMFFCVISSLSLLIVSLNINLLYHNSHNGYNNYNLKIDSSKKYVYNADYKYNNKHTVYDYCFDNETTYTYDGFDTIKCDNGKMKLSNLVVPFININSDDATNVNNKLELLYNEYAKMFDDHYESDIGGSQILTYYTYTYDDILSIVVTYGNQQTNVLYPRHDTYNFDLKTGNLLSYTDLLDRFKFDSDSLFNIVSDKVIDIMNQYGDKDAKVDVDGNIFTNYELFVNDFKESIKNGSVKWFINNDGILEYIVNIYTSGGDGSYYYRISSK